MKKTPLYQVHRDLKSKMIDFGDWMLPVQYFGIVDEHNNVRNRAGLFDVSHMGEIIVKGPNAEKYIQKIVTNDISKMKNHQIIYTPMCYFHGGVVDDLLVYRMNDTKYLMVVNAANIEKDLQWMLKNCKEEVEIEDVSDKIAQLALQGPESEAILQKLTETPLDALPFYTFQDNVELGGVKVLVSRTGYTGEDGFEIYARPEEIPGLWKKLLESGKQEGLMPAGLGARDTLRLEAALPLYGYEISQDVSPLEARLEGFVKLDKTGFIGKEALARQKEKGLERKLAGIQITGRGIPRQGYRVQCGHKDIGFITSGSYSPSIGKNIGLAMLASEYTQIGRKVDIIIRGKSTDAEVVKLPFYTKKYKR